MTQSEHTTSAPAPFDAALPYTTVAALTLALGGVVPIPTAFRLGAPALLMAAALAQALVAYVRREQLRAQADAWLADHRSPNTMVFAWRVEELMGAERKVVGRTLSSFAEEVMRPRRRGAPRLNRLQLRAESALISKVARALENTSSEVSPRAVVRGRLLITDCGSPLNSTARHDELHQALESILADISAPDQIEGSEPPVSPERCDAARRAAAAPARRSDGICRRSRHPPTRNTNANQAVTRHG